MEWLLYTVYSRPGNSTKVTKKLSEAEMTGEYHRSKSRTIWNGIAQSNRNNIVSRLYVRSIKWTNSFFVVGDSHDLIIFHHPTRDSSTEKFSKSFIKTSRY